MNRKARFKGLTVIMAILCIGLARHLPADDFKLEEGFQRLDNGKNLEGWTGDFSSWSVNDQAIHLNAADATVKKDPPWTCIYSKTTHGPNCIIRVQFNASKRADSGVYIYGKQLQVRDFPSVGPGNYAKQSNPAGEWNELEFDITDGVANIKLNGKVVEKGWKIGDMANQGLGLQREHGDFSFRRIRIKEK